MSFPWAQEYKPQGTVSKWVDERLPLPRLVYNAVGAGYPVPRNLNYFWNFGVLAGVALVIQIVTGIVLAMHYYASVDGAFNSVEHIMRDVNSGWFVRYAHMNGASFFFIVALTSISVSTPKPLACKAARVRASASSKLTPVSRRSMV